MAPKLLSTCRHFFHIYIYIWIHICILYSTHPPRPQKSITISHWILPNSIFRGVYVCKIYIYTYCICKRRWASTNHLLVVCSCPDTTRRFFLTALRLGQPATWGERIKTHRTHRTHSLEMGHTQKLWPWNMGIWSNMIGSTKDLRYTRTEVYLLLSDKSNWRMPFRPIFLDAVAT